MTDRRRRAYLIQDPYDLDAIDFIRTIDRYFGLRPVCFYTSPKDRFYGERRFPILTSDLVEAGYDVSSTDLAEFADQVGHRFDIAAVIPYREDTVEVAADLAELLDLDWLPPATLRRFRDKQALKTHIRTTDPAVRVPEHRVLTSADDLDGGPLPDRFVVKPNSGYGNRAIGIFAGDQLDDARRHVLAGGDETWILEEYVGGVEYHIDGHVRTDGVVMPLAVFEYVRTEANDYPTVYAGEVLCATTDEVFPVLVDYATRLLAATGLQRCPFHMEVKVDESGPCMIDLGARFASEGGARNLTRLHPSRLDAFVVAAHDYFAPNDVGTEPIDWSAYDRSRTVLVYGISERAGIIEDVSGVDEVERRPEFVRWLEKPRVGDELAVTTDLRGAPYIVELSCDGDRDDALRLIDEVRATVSWNDRGDARAAAYARSSRLMAKGRRKLRWLVHRATESIRRRAG